MSSEQDAVVTLDVLKKRIAAFAADRDWEQFHTPKNLSMAISAEAAELMEHFLWLDSAQSNEAAEGPKRAKIVEELADIIIYALEFSNIAGIDVAQAIEEKMAANALKYPIEKAKGNALKYDEF